MARFLRFWHNRNGIWCHAWDMDEGAWNIFREGRSPMRASSILLPSGDPPELGGRIRCGSCSDTHFTLGQMKIEPV